MWKASISGPVLFTLASDDDQSSAGARSAPTALLHLRKAAVTPPLPRSMQLDTPVGVPPTRERAAPIAWMRACPWTSHAPARDDDRAHRVLIACFRIARTKARGCVSASRTLPTRPERISRARLRRRCNHAEAAAWPGIQWADNGIAALSDGRRRKGRRPCQPGLHFVDVPVLRERPHPGRQVTLTIG